MKEKVLLDVPPIVEYAGENWNVGKVNHMDSSLKIWRYVKVIRGKHEFYDTEDRIIHASDAYKTDIDNHYVTRIVKEWGER